MRLAFQVALLAVAFVPFVLGALSLFQGAGPLIPVEFLTPELDGQVRFWGVRSMLPFLLSNWIVANLERARTVLMIVLGATAAGGLARIAAAVHYGAPEPVTVGIIVLELAVLLFIPWYNKIVEPITEPKPA